MDCDDHVCLCFHVSQRKLVAYLKREKPKYASQLSDCLGAGTGCHWCVPFLKSLHAQWERGDEPSLAVASEDYATQRRSFHRTGAREESFVEDNTDSASA